jgi:hypothetical protein
LAEHTKVVLDNAHDALADSIALKEICISFTKSHNLDLYKFLDLYKKLTKHFFKLEKERIKKMEKTGELFITPFGVTIWTSSHKFIIISHGLASHFFLQSLRKMFDKANSN